MANNTNRLYRLPNQGMIAGVAAGFAAYFKVDVVVMRLIFVAIAFANFGFAVITYLLMVAIMPTSSSVKPKAVANQPTSDRTRLYMGAALVLLGLVMVVHQLLPGLLDISWDLVWPIVLVLIGIWILKGSKA